MSNLIKGFLRETPLMLDTTATLEDLAASMANKQPDGTKVSRGWGSIYDDVNVLGLPNVEPQAAAPVIDDAVPGRRPRTLFARLYWYKLDKRLKVAFASSAPLRRYHNLQAIDLMITPVAGTTEHLVLASTLSSTDVAAQVVPALKLAVASLDAKAKVSTDSSILDLENDDFFLWLLRRQMQDQDITADLELDQMRQIRTRDPLRHATSMSEGVDVGRSELLALVAEQNVKFGPSKFAVREAALGFYTEMELFQSGAFAVTFKTTHYQDLDGMDITQQRIAAVSDVAHNIIPTLKAAYKADTVWVKTGRTQFRNDCRAELARRSTPGGATGINPTTLPTI